LFGTDVFTIAGPDAPLDDPFAEDPSETYVLLSEDGFANAGPDAIVDDPSAEDPILK